MRRQLKFVQDKRLIKRARRDAKLTQTQAGKLAGYSLRTWQMWERGESLMRVSVYEFFQKALRDRDTKE